MDQPGRYDITINQGKLYDRTWTWSINGTPVNLTGYSAKFDIYDDSNSVLLALTTTLDGSGNGLTVDNSGNVRLIMKTAYTKALTFRKARYELQLTQPDGEDLPFLVGNVYVRTEEASL